MARRDTSERFGSITPDVVNFHWSLVCSRNPASETPPENSAAVLSDSPQDGHRYVLYHETQGCAVAEDPKTVNALKPEDCPASGNDLTGPLPANTLIFTVQDAGEGTVTLREEGGRYLTLDPKNNPVLTCQIGEGNRSVWQLIRKEPGYYLRSAAMESDAALQYCGAPSLPVHCGIRTAFSSISASFAERNSPGKKDPAGKEL